PLPPRPLPPLPAPPGPPDPAPNPPPLPGPQPVSSVPDPNGTPSVSPPPPSPPPLIPRPAPRPSTILSEFSPPRASATELIEPTVFWISWPTSLESTSDIPPRFCLISPGASVWSWSAFLPNAPSAPFAFFPPPCFL